MELYFIVMSVSAVVLAGALSVILYLDRPPQSRFPTTLRNQISKRGTDAGLGQPGYWRRIRIGEQIMPN